MTNVLIRNVPADDLDEIRAAATQRGTSVQRYLRDAVHAHAVYLRRHAAVAQASERLRGRAAVPDEERRAVLAAVDSANDERVDQLSRSGEQ